MKKESAIALGVVLLSSCSTSQDVKQSERVKVQRHRKRVLKRTRTEQKIKAYQKQGYNLLDSGSHWPRSPYLFATKTNHLLMSIKLPPRRLGSDGQKGIEETVYQEHFSKNIRDKRYPHHFIVLRFRRGLNKKDGKWIIPYNMKSRGYWRLPGHKNLISMTHSTLYFSIGDPETTVTLERIKELHGNFDVEIWNKDKGLLFKKHFTLQFYGNNQRDFQGHYTCTVNYKFNVNEQICMASIDDRF